MCSLIAACSSVVEPISLPDLSPNSSLQEKFDVEVQPLNFKTAQNLNQENYPRLVSRPGEGSSANVFSETSLVTSPVPADSATFIYRLGIGDEVTLIQGLDKETNALNGPATVGLDSAVSTATPQSNNFLGEIATPQINNFPTWDTARANIIATTSRIGDDGSLLLMGIGRLEAKGRQLSDLRDEVRSILIRTGAAPNFQLEISRFNSQKVYITSDSNLNSEGRGSVVVTITDQGTKLRQLIALAGIAFNESILTTVELHRDGQKFLFTLATLLSERAPEIFLKNNDHVFIKNLKYLPGKVFLVGGVKPVIFEIDPANRQTLAEVLLSKNGPMEEPTAQRSAVYLLRGQNPIRAYHLDSQNPARILVADNVELRPNDIVYVAEQPISTFNRVLNMILPIRILSRDAATNNIP